MTKAADTRPFHHSKSRRRRGPPLLRRRPRGKDRARACQWLGLSTCAPTNGDSERFIQPALRE
jgi:hypothetical protein